MHPGSDVVVEKKSRRLLTCSGFLYTDFALQVSDSVRPDNEIFTSLNKYFPPDANQFQWARNPFMFPLAEQGLTARQQEELIDVSTDLGLKETYTDLPLIDFPAYLKEVSTCF